MGEVSGDSDTALLYRVGDWESEYSLRPLINSDSVDAAEVGLVQDPKMLRARRLVRAFESVATASAFLIFCAYPHKLEGGC